MSYSQRNGKFCQHCGNFIPASSFFCPKCNKVSESHRPTPSDSNGMAIAGFVLSFLIPILGLIFGIIGNNRADEGASGKGLSVAAITISIIMMVISFALLI